MEKRNIVLSHSKFTEIISVESIIYCKAFGSYTEIMLWNEEIKTASKNLLWFEKQCNGLFFCRIHKSYLVNLKYISKIFHHENMLLLKNQVKIPISHSKKKIFWEKFNRYNTSI